MKIIAKSLLAGFVIASLAFTTFQNNSEKTISVVIDVSHGGEDSGTTNGLLMEKKLVQQIAAKMELLNTNTNVQLQFTRTDDSFISLKDRVQFINNLQPDLVLSLHINQYKDHTASGMEVFYADKGKQPKSSKKLASNVISAMEAVGIFKTSTPKTANFYLLKNSESPAAAVEIGFLSNPDDSNILQDDQQQNEIAKVLLTAINN